MTAETRNVEAMLCQVSRSLDAGSWVTVPWLEFMGGHDGAGQDVGSATFRQFAGVRTAFNDHKKQLVGEVPGVGDIAGMLVRVLVRDDSGSVSIAGDNFNPCWHGHIITRVIIPEGKDDNNNGAIYEWQAAGLLSMLDQTALEEGLITTNGAPISSGKLLPFNSGPGTYASTVTSMTGTRIHAPTSTTKWTARGIIEYVLYLAGGGISWEISDPNGVLAYEPDGMNFDGATPFNVLMELAGPQRGITFTARGDDGFVTILFRSTLATSITVGGFTLPASSVTATFDLRENVFLEQAQFAYEYASLYDRIIITGAQPVVVLTLNNLIEGWTEEEQTAWQTNPTNAKVAHVFRRFTVASTWNGAHINGTDGLRNLLNLAIDDAYGQNGETGERFFDNPDDYFPPDGIDTDRVLPLASDYSATLDGPRAHPVVVIGNAESGWLDVVNKLKWGITVESNPPGITIDDGNNGLRVRSLLASGYEIRATIAIREPLPLRVSWTNPINQQPRQHQRSKKIFAPRAEQWIAFAGCIIGVDENKALITLNSELIIRNDVPEMRNALALHRGYFTNPIVLFSVVDRAIVDASPGTRPGTLITTVQTGNGPRTVNGVITSRRYVRVIRDNVPMFDTVYQAQRLVPNAGALL